ncbi:MAG: Mur ligase family protein [Candidatus Melainabacteria bacterium]|nr:Mur ligase family protein [Candidatus Melainabacteria bacterium]
MNYKESVAYIESLVPTLERPTLTRVKLFMAEEKDIQNKYKCFHVGGTNGKGSTATILETILSSAGQKVGKFTGPHIMRFNERFSFNGKTINDVEFAEIATHVKLRSDAFAGRHEDLGRLTWFEFLTAMAFFFFEKKEIDCAVLEVGLGGRFDATNIAENIAASIITNIDLDHMHILGDTVEKIAFEKAGIMRRGVPVVTAATGPALEVLKAQAQEKGAHLISMHEGKADVKRAHQISVHDAKAEEKGSHLVSPPSGKADVIPVSHAQIIEQALDCLSLYGPHQRSNAEMAVVALLASKFLNPPSRFLDPLADTLRQVYFAGRMQFVNNKILIMDGAHNPAGAKALRRALDQRLQVNSRDPETDGYCFILGFFGNKNVPELLQELLRKGDRVIAVEADVRRSTYPKEEIVSLCAELGIQSTMASSMSEALKLAQVENGAVTAGAGKTAYQYEKAYSNTRDRFEEVGASLSNRTEKAPSAKQSRASDNGGNTNCEVVVTGSFAVLKELMLTLGWETVDDGRDFELRS